MGHAMRVSRRSLLKAGLWGASGMGVWPGAAIGSARGAAGGPKLLFVVAAKGGASVMDAYLPLVAGQSGAGLNAYAARDVVSVPGSAFRAVATLPYHIGTPVGPDYDLAAFLRRHGRDMIVVTQEGTSVNHLVAAERALNGNGANRGRTVMEAVADRHGGGLLFPNVNMASGGYASPGKDASLAAHARPESVGDAKLFAFATHGHLGVAGALGAADLAQARDVRDAWEAAASFAPQAARSARVAAYLGHRARVPRVEAMDLITKLMLLDEQRDGVPLSAFGLRPSPETERIRAAFPEVATDPFAAQAALAFLLAKNGASCALTMGLGDPAVFTGAGDDKRMANLPIAFDWSHNNHRGAQNAMWRRVMQVVDALISLLKEEDYLGDPALGKMWDRSLVYVATEFGRTKDAGTGSAHHLNNGNVIISPLVNGNRVYGGIDPATGLTYGFDPLTGRPDPSRKMAEGDVYGLICHAMDVPFPGRRDMPALVRQA